MGMSAPPFESSIAPETLVRLLDLSVDAIITVDDDHRIVHFNRGAETIFGYDAREMLGKSLDILLPVDARSSHSEHMRRFASSRETSRHMAQRARIAGRRQSGERFPAEA